MDKIIKRMRICGLVAVAIIPLNAFAAEVARSALLQWVNLALLLANLTNALFCNFMVKRWQADSFYYPKYASIRPLLFNVLGCTLRMDYTAFRQHDHDYGGAGLQAKNPNGELYIVSMERHQADMMLRLRLETQGLSRLSAEIIWLGCRLLKGSKWHKTK